MSLSFEIIITKGYGLNICLSKQKCFFNCYYKGDIDKPHRARAVYMYLKDCAGKGIDCWPAVNTIAADMQLSRSIVKRALHDLIRFGLIEKETRYRKNGSHTSNRLILKKD